MLILATQDKVERRLELGDTIMSCGSEFGESGIEPKIGGFGTEPTIAYPRISDLAKQGSRKRN